MPKISVIMSVYNGEKYLAQSIESILNQTFKNFEFIIIDDASQDKSLKILKKYAHRDKRIKLLSNKKNMGLTKSLNKGLEQASGKYIARQDADDISLPMRFEMQVAFLENHKSYGIIGNNSYIIDEYGKIIGKFNRPLTHNNIVKKMLIDNQLVHSSLMIRKSLFEKFGYYNENYRVAQDYELLIRLLCVTKIGNMSTPLHKWRKNSKTGISIIKRELQIKTRDIIKRKFLKKYYSLNTDFINLVLFNYLNSKHDPVLSEYINKILKDVPVGKYFFIKFKILHSQFKNLKNRLYYHLKHKPRHQPHPCSLIFLMNPGCNAKCIMRGLNYASTKCVPEITLETYKKMLMNLDMQYVNNITFSGGGEPLLCKELIDIIQYTKELYPHVNLYLFTNGIALSKRLAFKLIQQNLCKITISINASKSETYFKVMRVNLFNKVVNNIKNFISIRNNNQKFNTKVCLSFVASLLNIKDLPYLILLAKNLGVDEVTMQYCRFYSKKYNLTSNESDNIIDKKYSLFFHKTYSDKILKKAIDLAKLKKIKFYHEPLFKDKNFKKQECTWPYHTILIGSSGEIYPCGGGEVMFYESVKNHTLYFGNLISEHISKFWNNKDFRRIRKSCYFLNSNKSISQCFNCNHTMDWEGPNSLNSHFINID